MNANMVALKKETEVFTEKELAWQKKVHELTQRHEVEVGKLKQQVGELEASLVQLAKDNKWLIEHQGYTAGYDAGATGSPKDKSPLFQPGAFKVFKNIVVKMEHLTYPYVGEVSECYGKPLSILQGLKLRGLNEVVCNEVLKSVSKKHPHSGDTEDTCSEGGNGSKDSSLEASEVAAAVRKKRKAKKAQVDGGKKDGGGKKDDVAKPTMSDAAK
ncbi:hypothetical protein Hanom_Chr01g00049171 [Helianthus anomalus]